MSTRVSKINITSRKDETKVAFCFKLNFRAWIRKIATKLNIEWRKERICRYNWMILTHFSDQVGFFPFSFKHSHTQNNINKLHSVIQSFPNHCQHAQHLFQLGNRKKMKLMKVSSSLNGKAIEIKSLKETIWCQFSSISSPRTKFICLNYQKKGMRFVIEIALWSFI